MRIAARRRFTKGTGVCACAMLLAALVFAPGASAAEYSPDTFDDEHGNGINCSLREAITAANIDANFDGCTGVGVASPDRIALPGTGPAGGTYLRTRLNVGPGEDANLTGDLDITDDLEIGPGGFGFWTIQGDGTVAGDRVLQVHGVDLNMRGPINVRNGNAGSTANGGGLQIAGAGTTFLLDVSFSNNTASSGGGLLSDGGEVLMINGTVSGNRALRGGGGISAVGGAPLEIGNTTVAGNTANSDFSGGDGDGGGIQTGIPAPIPVAGGAITLHNTIVAGNTDTDGQAPDCNEADGSLDALSYNLIGTLTGCSGMTVGATGNLTGVDPGLAPLQNAITIGGVGIPDVHPLYAGSPAIDAGNPVPPLMASPPICFIYPANYATRGDATNGRCDIGAYEGSIPRPPTPPADAGGFVLAPPAAAAAVPTAKKCKKPRKKRAAIARKKRCKKKRPR